MQAAKRSLLFLLPLAAALAACGSGTPQAVLLGLQCDVKVSATGIASTAFTLTSLNVYSVKTATLSSGGKTRCELENASNPPQSYKFERTQTCGDSHLEDVVIVTDGTTVSGSATYVSASAKTAAVISGSCQPAYGG
jgi:hypothetical protein